jgi:hypothetical protein
VVALASQVATDIGHHDLVRIVIKKDVHSIQMHSATITDVRNCVLSSTTPCKGIILAIFVFSNFTDSGCVVQAKTSARNRERGIANATGLPIASDDVETNEVLQKSVGINSLNLLG